MEWQGFLLGFLVILILVFAEVSLFDSPHRRVVVEIRLLQREDVTRLVKLALGRHVWYWRPFPIDPLTLVKVGSQELPQVSHQILSLPGFAGLERVTSEDTRA